MTGWMVIGLLVGLSVVAAACIRLLGSGRRVAQPTAEESGSIRFGIPEQDAEVYADGYFAGTVSDFDGCDGGYLKLRAESHRIEVRRPGFETLIFNVRVQKHQIINCEEPMRPIAATG
jgi:hypothetical protein